MILSFSHLIIGILHERWRHRRVEILWIYIAVRVTSSHLVLLGTVLLVTSRRDLDYINHFQGFCRVELVIHSRLRRKLVCVLLLILVILMLLLMILLLSLLLLVKHLLLRQLFCVWHRTRSIESLGRVLVLRTTVRLEYGGAVFADKHASDLTVTL